MSKCVLVYKDLEQHVTSRGRHGCKALEVEKILSFQRTEGKPECLEVCGLMERVSG